MSLPIQISLQNRFNEPVLYLPDGPQDLILEASNISFGALRLGVLETAQHSAAPALQLLLRPRVARVHPPQIGQVVQISQAGQTSARTGWRLSSHDSGTGVLMLTFEEVVTNDAERTELQPGDRLRISFVIDPDRHSGARLARVEAHYHLRGDAGSTPFKGSELLQLTLMEISRKGFQAALEGRAITSVKSGPFEASFIGSNVVVNDGLTSNVLHIRVVPNPDLVTAALPLAPDSSVLALLFDEADAVRPWGLRIKAVAADGKDDASVTASAPGDTDAWTEDGKLQWKAVATSMAVNGTFDLKIAVLSRAPSGFAPLRIEYRGIPGHADGMLVLCAQLTPLFVEEAVTDPLAGTGSRTMALAGPLRFVVSNARGPDGTVTGGPRLAPGPGVELRLEGALSVSQFLQVGPVSIAGKAGQLSVSGPSAEISLFNRGRNPAAPQPFETPGDRFVWYNQDGTAARLFTDGFSDGKGDLFFVTAAGDVGIGGMPENARLDVHLTKGRVQVRDSLSAMVTGDNFGGAIYLGAPNAGNAEQPTAGIEASWGGTDVSGSPNNPQVAIGVLREAKSRLPGGSLWMDSNGNVQVRQGRNVRLSIDGPSGALNYDKDVSVQGGLTVGGNFNLGGGFSMTPVTVNGEVITRPFAIKTFALAGDNLVHNTGWPVDRFQAGIIGFAPNVSSGSARAQDVLVQSHQGTWHITADITGVREDSWNFVVLFIRTELVQGGSFGF